MLNRGYLVGTCRSRPVDEDEHVTFLEGRTVGARIGVPPRDLGLGFVDVWVWASAYVRRSGLGTCGSGLAFVLRENGRRGGCDGELSPQGFSRLEVAVSQFAPPAIQS